MIIISASHDRQGHRDWPAAPGTAPQPRVALDIPRVC